ncbi:MAG: histidine phosphatase family protein [Spirochaetales bacterium]|nr:histidine phosphatase family protein [Spirochaetales bacterium]
MNNRYYALRHGQSEANEAGRIVSHPDEGTAKWGLTPLGRRQIEEGMKKSDLKETTLIITSDFLRARETAALAAEILGCPLPREDVRLRERYFGKYDGRDDSHYHRVWEHDEGNGNNREGNVESPEDVRARIALLVAELEENYLDRDILLVSHGDALQIGQTLFQGKESHEHRSLAHLETGEVRRLA